TNPATPGVGRLVLSVAASKDGTTVYNPNNPTRIDTTRSIQIGKLTKIDNIHLSPFVSLPTWINLVGSMRVGLFGLYTVVPSFEAATESTRRPTPGVAGFVEGWETSSS